MKKILNSALVITLAFLMILQGSAQVFADGEEKYISEVKVAMGGSAESDLKDEGFTIIALSLCCFFGGVCRRRLFIV